MNEKPPTPEEGTDSKFVFVVGALMLLIVVLLAGLWLRERRRALAAERDATALRGRLKGPTVPPAMRRALQAQFEELIFQRDALPKRAVTLNGRATEAFGLSAKAAAAIGGFRPGDVIVVQPPAATASAPAPP